MSQRAASVAVDLNPLTVLPSTVDSTDASGDKDGDPSAVSRDHGGGHGGTPREALSERDTKEHT